jgi:hypothetical protein
VEKKCRIIVYIKEGVMKRSFCSHNNFGVYNAAPPSNPNFKNNNILTLLLTNTLTWYPKQTNKLLFKLLVLNLVETYKWVSNRASP